MPNYYKTKRIARHEAKIVMNKNTETKYYDTILAASAIDATGTVFNLTSGITQGDTINSYIGHQITPVYLIVRFSCYYGDVTNLVRFIILQAKTTAPATPDILESTSNIRTPLSPFDTTTNEKWRVLWDKVKVLNQSDKDVQYGKIKIPMHKLRRLVFSDHLGNIELGGLYLYIVSDSTASTHPTVQYISRLSYKDA